MADFKTAFTSGTLTDEICLLFLFSFLVVLVLFSSLSAGDDPLNEILF